VPERVCSLDRGASSSLEGTSEDMRRAVEGIADARVMVVGKRVLKRKRDMAMIRGRMSVEGSI
jgi:hypothetical protein